MYRPRTGLTFAVLDDLALAASRRRVAPNEVLASHAIVRIGPLLELLLLSRSTALSLDALAECPIRQALNDALREAAVARGAFGAFGDMSFGFIRTGRDTMNGEAELQWVAFRQRAQQAAELSLPKKIAQGLIGAMTEIEENVHLHSERPHDGVVGFRGTREEFEFAVADSGIGVLASLRKSPDYAHLADAGTALRLALQDGHSRLKYLERNRGYGFRDLFRTLATINGELRFRSDDQAVTIDGVGPELVKSVLSQKAPLRGFAASVVCRPYRASI